MHYYIIYGLYTCCNIKLPLLTECYTDCNCELYLNVSFDYISSSDNIQIEKVCDNVYILFSSKYAKYKIDVNNNRIDCNAKDYESFFSTLFNIPLSIYLFLKKEKLLHVCSMYRENSLFCFSGKKGIGKSTLTHLLNGIDFKLYSDDTIRETKDGYGIRANNLIKLTDETIRNFGIIDVLESKNVMGKSYKKIDFNNNNPLKIKVIIQLYRTENTISLENITDNKIIRLLYTDNIVGANYFKLELLNNLFNISLPKNITFYKMAIPNDLMKLQTEINTIKKLLIKI